MHKLMLTALGALVLLVGGAAAGTLDRSSSDRVGTTTTSPAGDVSGPCDEAEHANDPRCGTAPARDDRRADGVRRADDDRREAGEDVRGPCGEAEHANDPRCTGAALARDDDRGRDGDRSGSNSGPG